MVTTAPYGTWQSPIDAALAASHDGKPEYPDVVGEEVWWTEPRPSERGRRALVRRRADGTEASVLPAPWNVRSRVIEYGGRPWAAVPRGEDGPLVVFVDFADQRLYAVEPDAPGAAAPRPLTPLSPVGDGLRWADPLVLPERGEVWCVLEEFTGDGPTDVRRVVVAVPLDGSAADDRGAIRELTGDTSRFVTGPKLSPDGRRAAWIAWDHPHMPWDATVLMLADVGGDGMLGGARVVVGGAGGPAGRAGGDAGAHPPGGDREVWGASDAPGSGLPGGAGDSPAGEPQSVVQAEWASDGALLFVSDVSGWWNLHRIAPDAVAAGGQPPASTALCPREEEFGGPLWRIGYRWFAPLPGGPVAVVHGRGGGVLGLLDPVTGALFDVPGPWTEWTPGLAVHGTRVVGVAASPRSGYEVVELDTVTGRTRVIGSRHRDCVDPANYPEGRTRTFSGPGGREIHAHLHPPRNPGHRAPEGELPPYIVWAHGGPTGYAPLVLDLEIAYFTSRGFGVAEVNYGGSTGYGRDYRNRLRGQWGVVDVEDCAAVARALADEGTADRARLAVRGGSAGGWTAAVSLATTDVYACGTIIYPVLDLEDWATGGTHDFESRYLESLVGPYAEIPDRYRDRSPVRHANGISVPFLLLQGLDDVICPSAQCERFVAQLPGRGVRHAYITFEGEGHGFRREDTMIRALEAELSLYAQTFGIRVPDVPALELL